MCKTRNSWHMQANDFDAITSASERKSCEMDELTRDPSSALEMLADHGPNEKILKRFRKKGEWHVNGAEIEFGKYCCVGKGSISSVFKAKFRQADVAVKVLRLVDDSVASSPKPVPKSFALDFEQEFKIVSMRLYHANIVKFVGASVAQVSGTVHPVLLYEYVSGGSIEGFVDTKRRIHSGQSWQPNRLSALAWCQQLCSAVAYLHENSLAHRDIKPANLLVTKDHKTVKLADFSLACPLKEVGTEMLHIPSVAGSLRYMAPEITFKAPYELEKADIYSAAMTCWFMLFGERPFSEHDPGMALCLAAQGQRPPVPGADIELSICLHNSWEVSPQKRPTAAAFAEQLGILLKKTKDPDSSWATRFSKKIRSLRGSKAASTASDLGSAAEFDAADAGEDFFITSHLKTSTSLPSCHSGHSSRSALTCKQSVSLPQLVGEGSTSWRRMPLPTGSEKSFSVSSVGNGHLESRKTHSLPVATPRSVHIETPLLRKSCSGGSTASMKEKKKKSQLRAGFD